MLIYLNHSRFPTWLQKEAFDLTQPDIENAFDRVWIEGLIFKLKTVFNFPDLLSKILYNYLIGRSFRVTTFNSSGNLLISNIFQIVAGTPQGSGISPALYLLYLSDVCSSSPSIPVHACNTLMYADDMLIYCRHNNASYASAYLNAHLFYLSKYFMDWIN